MHARRATIALSLSALTLLLLTGVLILAVPGRGLAQACLGSRSEHFTLVSSSFLSGNSGTAMRSGPASPHQMIGTLGEWALPNNETMLRSVNAQGTPGPYRHQPGFLAAVGPSQWGLFLPLIVRPSTPPSAPVLNPIANAGGTGAYTVTWSSVAGAESYVLEEAQHPGFAGAAQIYAGPATSYGVFGRGASRYYYRVRARNQAGDSPWSASRQVDVLWELEPNDTASTANGPLVSGLDYHGYPDDARDYFSIDTTTAGQLTLDLIEHAGQGVQLILYYDSTENQVARDYEAPYHIEHTGAPGRYYIHIYTESGFGSASAYTLRAVFP